MRSSRLIRIDIIERINDNLVAHGKNPLSPQDFDTLWDLDMDELLQAQSEIDSLLHPAAVMKDSD